MAMTCRTSDGDVLDTLCQAYYGHLNGTVEAVTEANQGLAEQRQPFQAGLLIMFPDMPAITPDAEHITLWD